MWCRLTVRMDIEVTKNKKRKTAIRELAEAEGVGVARAGLINDRGRESAILAWGTEWEQYTVWGTHSIPEAVAAVRRHLVYDVGGSDREIEELMPDMSEFESARLYWANPSVKDTEEVWTKDDYSMEPVEGWTPWMMVDAG